MKKILSFTLVFLSFVLLFGCSIVSTHEHTFSDIYEFNETSHYHVATCEHTELISSLQDHIYNDEGVCTVCGYIKEMDTPVHVHTFSNEWSKNDATHYHVATCEHTDLVKDLENHTFNDQNICNICGYQKQVEQEFIVSFVTNGDSFIEPSRVKEGDIIDRPVDPIKNDHVFIDWYDNANFEGQPYNFATRVTKDMVLYGLFGSKVTFINHDLSIYKEIIVKDNELLEVPTNPTMSGTHFIDWYDNEEFNGEPFDFSKPITKNTNLYARFGYKVELLINKEVYKEVIVPFNGRFYNTIENPTLDYYDFDKWYIDEELKVPYEFGEVLTSDITLYSRFTPKEYNINYINSYGLIHTNPTKYTYGVGVESFIEPTSNEVLNDKFYNWYLDENYTTIATIPSTLHEDINIYAKRATSYSITYENWPVGIENPNPTSYTKYDQIIFDSSILKDYPGFSSISFIINNQAVPGISLNTTGDIVVTMAYTVTNTAVTFNPNSGSMLPKDSYFYIDYQIPGMNPVRVDCPNKDSGKTVDIYDQNILKVPNYEGHVFMGYSLYSDSLYRVDEEYTNEFRNGETIYAIWYSLNDYENYHVAPLSYEGETYSRTMRIFIPYYSSKIKVSINTVELSSGYLIIIGVNDNDEPNFLFKKNVTNEHLIIIDESIDLNGYEYIVLDYYGCTKIGEEPAFASLSVKLDGVRSALAVATASDDTVTQVLDYWEDYSNLIPIRSNHTFIGWYDENDNLIDFSSRWKYTNESMSLIAKYVYDDLQLFLDLIDNTASVNKTELTNFEFLDVGEMTEFIYQIDHIKDKYKTKIMEGVDYEEGRNIHLTSSSEMYSVITLAQQQNLENCAKYYSDSLTVSVQGFKTLLETLEEEAYLNFCNALDTELSYAKSKISYSTTVEEIKAEYTQASTNLHEIYSLYCQ